MEESYDLEALHGLLRNEKNKFGTFNKILPPMGYLWVNLTYPPESVRASKAMILKLCMGS
tara:strand:+ start:161 stop:340 length:180 start_codon:yes stop_codon:yes gene_type:complete